MSSFLAVALAGGASELAAGGGAPVVAVGLNCDCLGALVNLLACRPLPAGELASSSSTEGPSPAGWRVAGNPKGCSLELAGGHWLAALLELGAKYELGVTGAP